MMVGFSIADKGIDLSVNARDVDMPRFVIEPKERVRVIVKDFYYNTVSMEPYVST